MTNDRKQQQKLTVSFHGRVTCIPSLHIHDYADHEVCACWYTRREYGQIKREVKVTVKMMDKKSKLAKSLVLSSRGLEDRTPEQMARKMEHQFFALDAVLSEQDRQRKAFGSVFDPESLRLVYLEYSFTSHMEAYIMGTTDEKNALRNNTKEKGTKSDLSRRGSKSKPIQSEFTRTVLRWDKKSPTPRLACSAA